MDLYDATINGLILEMETVSDSWQKAIAHYDIPYAAGPELEDLGIKQRSIRIRCYFWDDGADHATYEDHRTLLAILENNGLVELNHPIYGLLSCAVETVSINHDDRLRVAEVEVGLIHQPPKPEPAPYLDVAAAGDETFMAGQYEQMVLFATDATDQLGAEAPGILSRSLTAGQAVLEQFQDVSRTARAYVAQVDTAVRTVEAKLLEVQQPVNGIISVVNYGTSLPGRFVGAIAATAERYATLYTTLKNAPARFLESFHLGMQQLENAVGPIFGKHVRIAAAHRVAWEAAQLFKSDEASRQQLRRQEGSKPFDVQGRYQPQETVEIMTIRDLEQALATSRQMLQDAIAAARDMPSLKTSGRQLLEHVNSIKLERERIITITVDNPLPLHLICLANGLDYHYAERIVAINDLKNPNTVQGEVRIYAR